MSAQDYAYYLAGKRCCKPGPTGPTGAIGPMGPQGIQGPTGTTNYYPVSNPPQEVTDATIISADGNARYALYQCYEPDGDTFNRIYLPAISALINPANQASFSIFNYGSGPNFFEFYVYPASGSTDFLVGKNVGKDGSNITYSAIPSFQTVTFVAVYNSVGNSYWIAM